MKFIIFLTIISEIFLNASFDYSSRGTTALQTLRINSSPRCSALGEACGSDIKDASTVEINPANLVMIKNNSIFISHSSFSNDIKLENISYAKKLSRNSGSIGVSLRIFNWGNIEETDDSASTIGTYNPKDIVFTLGFANYISGMTKDPSERFAFGGSVKFINTKIKNNASAVSADVALKFPSLFEKKFIVSIVFSNLIGSIKMDKERYNITKIFRIATTTLISKNMTINSDIIMPEDSFLYWTLGTENTINISKISSIALRFGISTKNIKDMNGSRVFNFGFGIKYIGYQFDYSYSPFGELGDIQRISVSIKF